MDKMNMTTPDKIRIKDIAMEAGVSTGTVDRVLHGRPNVSEESRKKVEAVLRRINYQPNRYASALASNKRFRFEFLLPEHQSGDYFSYIEEGIRTGMESFRDFNLNIGINYYNPFDGNSFLEKGEDLLIRRPEGCVIVPMDEETTRKITDKLNEEGISYIFLDSTLPALNPLAFYGQDSRKSGRFAAHILSCLTKENGDLTIFKQLVGGQVRSNQQLHREEGFRAYFAEKRPDVVLSELILPYEHPEVYTDLLDAHFREHPKTSVGVAFFSRCFYIGEYLQKRPSLSVKVLGYDLLEKNKACLKEGSVEFLITQHPVYQGFGCLKTLFNHFVLKEEVGQCNHYMPIELLSMDNVDFYQHRW